MKCNITITVRKENCEDVRFFLKGVNYIKMSYDTRFVEFNNKDEYQKVAQWLDKSEINNGEKHVVWLSEVGMLYKYNYCDNIFYRHHVEPCVISEFDNLIKETKDEVTKARLCDVYNTLSRICDTLI